MRGRPGLRIVLPSMPRTNDLAVGNHALPQRPSPVNANVIHGGERAVHIGQANHLLAGGKLFGFVRRGQFALAGDFDKLSHDSLLPNPCFVFPNPGSLFPTPYSLIPNTLAVMPRIVSDGLKPHSG